MAAPQTRAELLCMWSTSSYRAPRVGRVASTFARARAAENTRVLATCCVARNCNMLQKRAQSRSRKCSSPTVRPGPVPDRAQPGQHARGERGPVQRVVPDRERLPHAAQDHLLVRHQAAHPQPVHPDAVHVGAAGAVERGAGRVGDGREAGLATGGRDQLGGTPRGAGGRVGLVRVVQLDHLDRLVERRRRDGEPHHQHRADREVGRDQDPDLRSVGQPRLAASPAGRRRSRWCRPPRGCRGRCRTRRLSITASGWVKSTTAWASAVDQRVELVVDVELRHQLEVLGGLDRAAHLAADLALRAEHARPVVPPSRAAKVDRTGGTGR